jgi:hypothetical protein
MQVVELPHAGEAALQHLHEGLSRDGLDLIRAEPVKEAVHPSAPSPEIVVNGATHFSETRHPSLETMAVDIAEAGHDRAGGIVLHRLWLACLDGADHAVFDRHAHVPRPAAWKQRRLKPQHLPHLDSGSVASPNRETEAMRDGSDAVSDWPLLNALLNTASGATWVSLHHGGGVGMGYSQHAGMVIVADGTPEAARRLERVLWNDPATGVMRHADAGYAEAVGCAKANDLDLPSLG